MAAMDMVMDTDMDTIMARDLLMPGMDMVDSMAMALDWAMVDMVLAMDTERGLLMLRPNLRLMHGTDMVASMAMALDWAMVDMVLAMDTERGPLMPSLRLMLGTD